MRTPADWIARDLARWGKSDQSSEARPAPRHSWRGSCLSFQQRSAALPPSCPHVAGVPQALPRPLSQMLGWVVSLQAALAALVASPYGSPRPRPRSVRSIHGCRAALAALQPETPRRTDQHPLLPRSSRTPGPQLPSSGRLIFVKLRAIKVSVVFDLLARQVGEIWNCKRSRRLGGKPSGGIRSTRSLTGPWGPYRFFTQRGGDLHCRHLYVTPVVLPVAIRAGRDYSAIPGGYISATMPTEPYALPLANVQDQSSRLGGKLCAQCSCSPSC